MIDNRSIIAKATDLGVSLAGIASVEELKQSPSYAMYDRSPYYDGYAGVEWPVDALSVLVLALAHDRSQPELDWWSDDIPGRTPGNRILMDISRKCAAWLREAYAISACSLPYPIERGGIFLKDAAVLAGLGIIGENNLLITPRFGSRVRLRALFLDAAVPPSPRSSYNPCVGCAKPCHTACPEDAFRNGRYEVTLCHREMERNRSAPVEVAGRFVGIDIRCRVTKFCRECEFACPVAGFPDL